MPTFKHIRHNNFNWYHFDQPLTDKDRLFLAHTFSFSLEDLDNCRHKKTQRPRIKSTTKYAFLIFHIPYLSQKTKKFAITELNVFITKTALITVESTGDLTALNHFLNKTKNSSQLTEQRFKTGPTGLFSKLILTILAQLLEHIDKQGEEIDHLHREIFEKHVAKRFVENISRIRYNQVVTHNALERQNRILDQFRGDNNPLLSVHKTNHTNWNKILETFQIAQYETESDMDHLEGLVKTFESLITFHTNETIKLLTLFSVILLPLTLISGIYGMNFKSLPFANDPFGFTVILSFMLFIATIMTLVFKIKRWL